MFKIFERLKCLGVMEDVYKICHAPLCNEMVLVTIDEQKKSIMENDGQIFCLCPEHMERVSAGRISDYDAFTNPDLNNKGE